MDLFASPGRVDMAFMNTNLSPAPEAFHEDPSVAFE